MGVNIRRLRVANSQSNRWFAGGLCTSLHGALRKAMILMERGLQKHHHAQKLCTVDSSSGRQSKEREVACTGISTALSRWMNWRMILSRRTILTILTQLWAALVAVHVVGALQLRLAKVAQ